MEVGFSGATESAVKTLEAQFENADATLKFVQKKLEIEFDETYANHVNPLKLVARIKKIHEDLPLLKEECDKLLAAKQDLIDKARNNLVRNRVLLQRLQARAGLPLVSDADDSVYASFVKTLEEWDQQLGMPSRDAVMDNRQFARPDLNLELFRSKS